MNQSPRSSSFRTHTMVTMNNPLHCGYMLSFCENEYNTENLGFIIEVDRLRDNMLIDTVTRAWQLKEWRDIDADFGFHGNFLRDTNVTAQKRDGEPDNSHQERLQDSHLTESSAHEFCWPSQAVDRRNVETDVKKIWEQFVQPNSPSQICLSSPVVERTAFRMKYLHIYGPDVFSEAVEEHMVNTIEVDTLPRFSNSEIFAKMTSLLCTLCTSNTLEVPSPPNTILQKSTAENLANKVFQLIEILSDGVLYCCLLRYLKEFSSEKYLLCLQMIAIFEDEIAEDHVPNECVSLVEKYAWEIYRYFVTRNSVFEIILFERERKEIMRNLAKPVSLMFKSLRTRSYEMLEFHFESFSKTDQYMKLNLVMIKALQSRESNTRKVSKSIQNKIPPKVGCFNF
jgi:Regulator of G protein signaling domain